MEVNTTMPSPKRKSKSRSPQRTPKRPTSPRGRSPQTGEKRRKSVDDAATPKVRFY